MLSELYLLYYYHKFSFLPPGSCICPVLRYYYPHAFPPSLYPSMPPSLSPPISYSRGPEDAALLHRDYS